MKVKSYFTPTLFAYKEVPVEDFKRETLLMAHLLKIHILGDELVLILPSQANPEKISRAIGLPTRNISNSLIDWVYALHLPEWP